MPKKLLWIFPVFIGLVGLLAFSYLSRNTGKLAATPKAKVLIQADQHPGWPENKTELESKTCRDCHMETTPEVYKEWANGRHGIANVRCTVCHGSFEDFKSVPTVETCRSCHAKEYDQMMLPSDLSKKTCWQCHPAHSESVHRIDKTKPSPLH